MVVVFGRFLGAQVARPWLGRLWRPVHEPGTGG